MASKLTPTQSFSNLTICSWNANGLRSKRLEVIDFLAMHKVNILLVQETHLQPHHKMKLPGMRCFRSDRGDGYGGTAIFVDNSIPHHQLDIPPTQHLEATGIHIKTDRGPLNVYSVYIPPRRQILERELDHLFSATTPTIAAGDYNAKHTSWNSSCTTLRGSRLYNYAASRALLVQSPNSPTIHYDERWPPDWLDIAIIKNLRPHIRLHTVPSLSSDHYPIIMSFPSRTPLKTQRAHPSPRTTNWQEYTDILAKHPPVPHPCDTPAEVDHLAQVITESLLAAVKVASPKPTLQRFNGDPLPKTTRELIAAKNRARRRFQFSRSPEDKSTWRRLQQQVKDVLREYSNDKWNTHLSNLRPEDGSLWRTTKSLMGAPRSNPPLRHGQVTALSGSEKAELQATFLESTFQAAETRDQDHVLQIHTEVDTFLRTPSDPTEVEPTTVTELLRIAQALKPFKAAGPDGLTNAALKALPQPWMALLAHLFNSILRTAHFPTCWKHARVITICKPGKNPSLPESYRPISLLPVLSKFFEKVVQARLQSNLERHQIIRPEQFGFRRQHSTVHQLLRLVDAAYTTYNRRHFMVALLLDVSRAFDSVWHDGLISRLIHYQVPPILTHLLNSYLRGRTFSVAYEEVTSAPRPIRAGVPQGSVLGPTLFLIYINTLPVMPNCSLFLFADDTAITTSSSQHQMAVRRLQGYADVLTTWFSRWRLSIHPQKSQAITFTRRRPSDVVPIRLAGEPVPWSTSVAYLGVTLDEKLTWQAHLENVSNKVSKRMAMLYPLYNKKSALTLQNKLLLYKQVIRPAMTYGCQVWGVTAKTHLHKLQVLQSRFLRISTNSPYYLPNNTIHRDLGIPAIDQYIHFLCEPFFNKLSQSFNQLIRGLGEYDLDPGETYKRPRLVLGPS